MLAMEYPGYGIYQSETPSEESILRDAEKVFNYITEEIGIKRKRIIVMGRSIGSGAATHVAAKFKPGAFVLVSAFTSIKAVASNLFGFLAKIIIQERFDNLTLIKKVKSPTLLIHGKIDTTIPFSHSEKLYSKPTTLFKTFSIQITQMVPLFKIQLFFC